MVWQPNGFCVDARRHDRGAGESAQHWKPELDSADPNGASGDFRCDRGGLLEAVRKAVNQE